MRPVIAAFIALALGAAPAGAQTYPNFPAATSINPGDLILIYQGGVLKNISLITTQAPNTVYAGPVSGANAAPAYRALVGADLPFPSTSSLGGVQSVTGVSHQWIKSISTTGVPSLSQPAASDISGLAPSATTDTTNASNIGSGLLSPSFGGTGAANTGALSWTGTLTFTDTTGQTFALPAASTTLAGLGTVQTWTATQTFPTVKLTSELYLSTGSAAQTGGGLLASTGNPTSGVGNNGDFYFRTDCTHGSSNCTWHKESGTWYALN